MLFNLGSPVGHPNLVDHCDLPTQYQDNEYVIRGYRRPGLGHGALPSEHGQDSTVSATATPSRPLRSSARKRGAAEPKKEIMEIAEVMSVFRHDSFTKCWKSVWDYWHNETVNIHTHLWGSTLSLLVLLVHLYGLYYPMPNVLRPLTHHSIFVPPAIKDTILGKSLYVLSDQIPPSKQSWAAKLFGRSSHPTAPQISTTFAQHDYRDTLGFTIFLISAAICLGFSATYHTVQCHSWKVSRQYNKLDYIGIVVLIVGSFLPALHYGFMCHPHFEAMYAASVTTLGALAAYVVLAPVYATPAYRPLRTSVFLALGLSSIFPVLHLCQIYGFSTVSRTMGLSYLVASGAFYVAGALIYMARVPERFWPGKFDFVGSSHQVFHVMILVAAFLHYVSLRRSYAFWHGVAVTESLAASTFGFKAAGAAKAGVCRALAAAGNW